MKTSNIIPNIENRLNELQAEYKKGEEQLKTLEQETATIKATMLRIGGAIQVLQEVLEQEQAKYSNGKTAESLNE